MILFKLKCDKKTMYTLFSEPIDPDVKLIQTKNLIKLASYCYGKAFGEYVRNMIILKNCDCHYVNIWFKSGFDAEKFVSKAKMNLNFLESENNIYSLFHESMHVIYVKIFIGKKLPVNDFDINCLTYYYQDNNFFLDREILTIKVDLLIDSVKNKKMLMFYSYGRNLDDSKLKIITAFSQNGWNVRYNGRSFSVKTLL